MLAREDRLRGRFIAAAALTDVIKKRYTFVDDLDFNTGELNRAMVNHFPQIDGSTREHEKIAYIFSRFIERKPYSYDI